VKRAALALIALVTLARGSVAQDVARQQFDHAGHAKLFPSCATCHQAPATGEGAFYPDSARCATCHDGTVQARVSWTPPATIRRTNLRFDHALVATMFDANHPEPPKCTTCHEQEGKPWMTSVGRINQARCLSCHGVTVPHLEASDTMCTVCHLALPEAQQVTRADIAGFPVPPTHKDPAWPTAAGHGHAAESGAGGKAPARCTVCHAREFCMQCHVDAPERPIIQSITSDPRSTAIVAHLAPPPSHANPDFWRQHGATARSTPAACSTCHARESCLTCHVGTPQVAAQIPPRGAGRGTGAVVVRQRPLFHGQNFANQHAQMAARSARTCAGCHVREDCMTCHRLESAAARGYHPADFLTRHPAAAYARETSCSDCHNTAGFCMTCHAASGLHSTGVLRGGYHDGNQFFISGHGQAARQSLETCVACHVERDCLTCHAANGGRGYNPHGPGFDAARLKSKNPQMCTVCHGTAIPG